MIILPMSSLTKIFVPEQWPILQKNPEKVFEDYDFGFSVNTSRRDYRFNFRRPKYETNQLLLNWFLGGDDGMQCQETDWTGLVKLDMDDELNSTILGSIAGITTLNEEAQQIIERAKKKAKDLADARVMKQIRAINMHMLKQYEVNKEDNKNVYIPSTVELMCAFVLSEEKAKESEERRALSEKFQEFLKKSF